MTFDPLCGDGTANAVRESILATAVIRAVLSNGNMPELLSHYRRRLTSGFRRHLAICRQFYSNGRGGEWWQKETGALETGHRWCAAAAGSGEHFDYRLRGYNLERLDDGRR